MNTTQIDRIRKKRNQKSKAASDVFAEKTRMSSQVVEANWRKVGGRNQNYIQDNQINLKNSLEINIGEPSGLPQGQQNNKQQEQSFLNNSSNSQNLDIPQIGNLANKSQQQNKDQNSSDLKIPSAREIIFSNGSKIVQILSKSQMIEGNFVNEIKQILGKENLYNLKFYENYSKDLASNTQDYSSSNSFNACIFYVIDLVFRENEKITNQLLKQSLGKLDISIRPDLKQLLVSYGSIQFQQNGSFCQNSEIQIKKIFFQYFFKHSQSLQKETVTYFSQYFILQGVIEVMALNFMKSKLKDRPEQFEQFQKQYFQQRGDPHTIFKTVANVFELSFNQQSEQDNQNTEAFQISSQKTKIMIKQKEGVYTSKISK